MQPRPRPLPGLLHLLPQAGARPCHLLPRGSPSLASCSAWSWSACSSVSVVAFAVVASPFCFLSWRLRASPHQTAAPTHPGSKLRFRRMGKSCGCETCRQWAEHHYWDILEDQGKGFFKVIMDDLHEMTIPEKFVQRFKGKISGMIKLETRNGSIADVAVKTAAGKIILQYGWEEFANTHDLGKGDFLVFRYNGDSQFKIGIFNPSGCEKVSSCISMNNPRPTETVKSSHEHNSRRSLDYTTDKSSSSAPSEEPGDSSSSKYNSSGNNVPRYMIGNNVHLTPVQKGQVKEIVKAINSNIHILVTIMCKSHLNSCRFEFMRKYGDTYLPQEKQRVVLQRRGKRWKMWLNAATSRDRGLNAASSRGRGLIRGWRQFVEDNDLQIGDICLFDMLNNKKMCTMDVHIIRARKGDR